MSTDSIIEKHACRNGWDHEAVAGLLAAYIENNHSDAALDDFLTEAGGGRRQRFLVTIYQETYTTVLVGADNEEEAKDKALMGDHLSIDDVTVKEPDIESVKPYKE